MQQQVDKIEKQVGDIHSALCGNEYSKGLISRIDDIEKYQKKDQKQKWVAVGIFFGFSTLLKYWEKITHLF